MDINGHYAPADTEWEHHFRLGGYVTTRYVDLLCNDDEIGAAVLSILRSNGLSGHSIEGGYRVYGYALPGEAIAKF